MTHILVVVTIKGYFLFKCSLKCWKMLNQVFRIFLEKIMDWGCKKPCTVQHLRFSHSHCPIKCLRILMLWLLTVLSWKQEIFNLGWVIFQHNLMWYKHVAALATFTAKKLVFLFPTRKYCPLPNCYTLYIHVFIIISMATLSSQTLIVWIELVITFNSQK